MNTYFLLVFAVGFACMVGTFISYDGGNNTAVKCALALMLLLATSKPILAFAKELSESAPPTFEEWEGDFDYEYEEVAKDAFCEGIAKLLCNKYLIDEECFAVKLEDFDFNKMKAGGIYVTLYGKAVFCDPLSVENFVNEYDLGVCYAKVGI